MKRRTDQPRLFSTDAHGPYRHHAASCDPDPALPPVESLSAAGDPETSAQAAKDHDASGARSGNAALVLTAVQQWPGRTAVELWSLMQRAGVNISRHEVSRRAADLKNAGAIVQGSVKTCNVSGTRQTSWWPAEDHHA